MWGARELQPGEKVAIERTLVQLTTRDAPAPIEQIDWHIGKLLTHWDSKQSDVEKGEIVADYETDLAPFSEANIAEACAIWRRTAKFRPHVADIIELTVKAQARDRENIRRCKVLLGMEKPRNWERIPERHQPITLNAGQRAMIESKIGKLGT